MKWSFVVTVCMLRICVMLEHCQIFVWRTFYGWEIECNFIAVIFKLALWGTRQVNIRDIVYGQIYRYIDDA